MGGFGLRVRMRGGSPRQSARTDAPRAVRNTFASPKELGIAIPIKVQQVLRSGVWSDDATPRQRVVGIVRLQF